MMYVINCLNLMALFGLIMAYMVNYMQHSKIMAYMAYFAWHFGWKQICECLVFYVKNWTFANIQNHFKLG